LFHQILTGGVNRGETPEGEEKTSVAWRGEVGLFTGEIPITGSGVEDEGTTEGASTRGVQQLSRQDPKKESEGQPEQPPQ